MTRSTISRRRFLALAGGTAGAAALAGVSLGAASPFQQKTESSEATYGGTETVNDRILVAYATKTGSTVGVAEAVGKQLAAGGAAVDVRNVNEVRDLAAYHAVVVGSAINCGKWLPEAVSFVEANRSSLNRVPTAFFLVCLMAANPTEQNQQLIATFLDPVRSVVQPVAEGRFAGRLLYDRYSFFDKMGMRIFARTQNLAEADYRNWTAISTWSEATRPLLAG